MKRISLTFALLSAFALTSGCVTTGGGQSNSSEASVKSEPQPATNATSGNTKKVKGLGNWEGEVTGTPARGSHFGKLKIGMSIKQVTDTIGKPTDQGEGISGKAYIPFYGFFAKDVLRTELLYKNQGRLIFNGGIMTGGTNLVSIINDAQESGYRN